MGVDFANQVVVSEYARTTIRVKAGQLVRQPGFSRSDLEDVEQELIVHLLSKAQQFDPDRGSLNTFIFRVIDSGVAMLVRKPKAVDVQSTNGNSVPSVVTIIGLIA